MIPETRFKGAAGVHIGYYEHHGFIVDNKTPVSLCADRGFVFILKQSLRGAKAPRQSPQTIADS
jgi:hypothetical protein